MAVIEELEAGAKEVSPANITILEDGKGPKPNPNPKALILSLTLKP